MELKIQQVTAKDYFSTENLTRETFWNLFKPGCDEHYLLHNLRKCRSYIKELDLVAIHKGELVGHIISTKAKIVDPSGNDHDILCVGPLSVLPELQKQGVGTKLLNESIRIAKELRYSGMILFGHPDYYHRFGFRNAQEYEITTKDLQNFDAFMALELRGNALADVKGKFIEDNAFDINPDEVDTFDQKFPYKKKEKTNTQFT